MDTKIKSGDYEIEKSVTLSVGELKALYNLLKEQHEDMIGYHTTADKILEVIAVKDELSMSEMTIEQLREEMRKCVDKGEYEKASKIRTETQNRELQQYNIEHGNKKRV